MCVLDLTSVIFDFYPDFESSQYMHDLKYVSWFNFILGLIFIFVLFLVMVMYDNEFKTKQN